MRKKTINHIADTVFWYGLYFLPVIAFLLYLFCQGEPNIISIPTFFNDIGIGFVTDNIVYTSLDGLFGANGVLPFFTTQTPILIFTWFITVFICHLCVDFILFIPRLCHKWMKAFTQGE